MTMNASGSKPHKVEEVVEEFLKELFWHHLGCGIFRQSLAMSKTDDETPKANPLEMAGGRFEAELLRRFHHDRSIEVVDQPGQEKFEEQ